MKCPKCNKEMEDDSDFNVAVCGCGYKFDYHEKRDLWEHAHLWQARAEKAEGELKAIRDRIEAVIINKDNTLYYILDGCYCDNNMNGIAERRIKKINQKNRR